VALIAASSALHAQTSLQACETVCRNAVDFAVVATRGIAVSHVNSELFTVGVFAGEVEQVDTSEDREKSTEKGNGVARVDGVEATEEDERSDEGECGERDVVERVDTVRL
jgi:hypothetical protein